MAKISVFLTKVAAGVSREAEAARLVALMFLPDKLHMLDFPGAYLRGVAHRKYLGCQGRRMLSASPSGSVDEGGDGRAFGISTPKVCSGTEDAASAPSGEHLNEVLRGS
ncbi:hypothetical protein ACFWBH_35850 [Streptomyces sp. NPDC059999]|uniref:hypothetical protein n=1 Tax=Streptomyces sp. NPDC059999 TaxID=3347030 RepID=UPI0036C66929